MFLKAGFRILFSVILIASYPLTAFSVERLQKENLEQFKFIPSKEHPHSYQFVLDNQVDTVEFWQPLPDHVDLRPNCPPVTFQGTLGSCAIHTITSAMEYALKQKGELKSLSRLFLYFQARALRQPFKKDLPKSTDLDKGLPTLCDGIMMAHLLGVCSEELWPYVDTNDQSNPNKFKEHPAPKCYENAVHTKILDISNFMLRNDISAWKKTLAKNTPVLVGFVIYDNFYKVNEDGIIPMTTKESKCLGGHALLMVGYDDRKDSKVYNHFLIRNSWKGWGKEGYAWIPSEYLTTYGLEFGKITSVGSPFVTDSRKVLGSNVNTPIEEKRTLSRL